MWRLSSARLTACALVTSALRAAWRRSGVAAGDSAADHPRLRADLDIALKRVWLGEFDLPQGARVLELQEEDGWVITVRYLREQRTLGVRRAVSPPTDLVAPSVDDPWQVSLPPRHLLQVEDEQARLESSSLTVACAVCKGAGLTRCRACHARGWIDCADCGATGIRRCRRCNGRQHVLALAGETFFSRQENDEGLAADGRSTALRTVVLDCPACENGKETCSCLRGRRRCAACGGSRDAACVACAGAGAVFLQPVVERRFAIQRERRFLLPAIADRVRVPDQVITPVYSVAVRDRSALAAQPDIAGVPGHVWLSALEIARSRGASEEGRIVETTLDIGQVRVRRVHYSHHDRANTVVLYGVGDRSRLLSMRLPRRLDRVAGMARHLPAALREARQVMR